MVEFVVDAVDQGLPTGFDNIFGDAYCAPFGMVNATPDFAEHPQVINGYSELMAEVFGPENGVGTRSAVGMGSLPNNIAVEIEAVFEVTVD